MTDTQSQMTAFKRKVKDDVAQLEKRLRALASKVAAATPLRGLSAISEEGQKRSSDAWSGLLVNDKRKDGQGTGGGNRATTQLDD